MNVKSFLKKTFQKRIHLSRWVGYSQWQLMGQFLAGLLKSPWLFSETHLKENVSFEDKVKQLGLTEKDLLERQKYFQRLMGLWLVFFVLAFGYGIYLSIKGAWLGVVSVFILSVMMLLQAFQYHFWSFQIMQRRFDCTLRTWWCVTFQKRWPW